MLFSKQFRMMLMAVAGIGLGFTSKPVLATTFNAGFDFSPTTNPTGVWSYGWSSNLGIDFNLYTEHFISNDPSFPTSVWSAGVPGLMVEHNGTGNVFFDPFHLRTLSPAQLALHPSHDGRFSVLRWQAPETGTYSLTSIFDLLDASGGSTDVHVLHNGVPLFSDLINGFGSPGSSTSFDTTLSVAAHDTIDFAVGFGSNLDHTNDTTGLDVTITSVDDTVHPTPVPEPTSIIGLLAFSGLTISTLRKKLPSI